MLKIMKNNWNRLMQEKGYLITALVLTICSMGAAILLTSNTEMKGNIAVVINHTAEKLDSSPYFNITYLEKEPPMSQLLQNRYDAVVTINNDGSYEINTIKNKEFKDDLQGFLTNPSGFTITNNKARKIGTNILGFMMMFLLMQGALYARFFAEDKEKHMIERVSMSPTRFGTYLLGNSFYIWLLIFVPSFAVIGIAKLCGIAVGFSILQYILLIGLVAMLSVAFSLLINSFFCVSDTANMLASSIIVLTSLLAGSFYSITKEDTFINKLIHIFPQKDFINFADALEKGTISTSTSLQISYVILLSISMFAIAVFKTKRDYIYKK